MWWLTSFNLFSTVHQNSLSRVEKWAHILSFHLFIDVFIHVSKHNFNNTIYLLAYLSYMSNVSSDIYNSYEYKP